MTSVVAGVAFALRMQRFPQCFRIRQGARIRGLVPQSGYLSEITLRSVRYRNSASPRCRPGARGISQRTTAGGKGAGERLGWVRAGEPEPAANMMGSICVPEMTLIGASTVPDLTLIESGANSLACCRFSLP